MASITSWNRLDPISRHKDMTVGLQAQVHDPLWMLARQWQTLEFQAADAGSPVWTTFTAEQRLVSDYLPGQKRSARSTAVASNGQALPLETWVEREPVRRQGNLRLAAEGGVHFLRLLRAHLAEKYRSEYVDHYPLQVPDSATTLDDASRRFIGLMAGRVPDGEKLHAALLKRTLGREPFVAAADRDAIGQAIATWKDWYGSLFSEQDESVPGAWTPERLEYSFRVSADSPGGGTVLAAPGFGQGKLDWYAFDVQSDKSTIAPSASRSQAIPTQVSFPGMPATRWWQFEDARLDYGAVRAEPADLARMVFVDLAITYGNDWFVIPVEMPVGTICRAPQVEVIDSFGERIAIPHYSSVDLQSGQWRMFALTAESTAQADSLFFLPPVLGPILESTPIEDVVFLRDEMTNLAWAIEKTVESPTGRPLNRYEAYQERQRRQQESETGPGPTAGLRYRLGLEVPDYWIPLSPTDAKPGIVFRGVVRLFDYLSELVRRYQRRLPTPIPGDLRRFVVHLILSLALALVVWIPRNQGWTVRLYDYLAELIRRNQRRLPTPIPGAPRRFLVYAILSLLLFLLNWIPRNQDRLRQRLAPGKRASGLRLEVTPLPRLDGTYAAIPPQGVILEPDRPLSLFAEEIPRSGVQVTRTYQYARWINGETFLWVGRRKRTGRGEGSSGLRFDVVLPENGSGST